MALISIPPMLVPARYGLEASVAPALISYSISASGDKVGFVLRASKTGTISKVGFLVGSVTTAQNLDVRLETVNATGDPSGTLLATNTNATVTPTANTWFWATLTAGASVTRGDVFAVVITWVSTVGSLNIVGNLSNMGTFGAPYVDTFTAAAWGKQSVIPDVAVEYSDVSRPSMGCLPATAVTTRTFNSTSSPDEIGIRFTLPFTCKIIGGVVKVLTSGGNSFTLKLYDAASTTLTSVSYDLDQMAVILRAGVWIAFPAETIISANVLYRMTVVPDGGANVDIHDLTVDSNGTLESHPLGINVYKTQRTDAGAWTDTNTQRPIMGLIVSALEDGASQLVAITQTTPVPYVTPMVGY